MAFKADNHVFFVYGFEKNVRTNISQKEEIALKKLAKVYFDLDDKQLEKAVKEGTLTEVK